MEKKYFLTLTIYIINLLGLPLVVFLSLLQFISAIPEGQVLTIGLIVTHLLTLLITAFILREPLKQWFINLAKYIKYSDVVIVILTLFSLITVQTLMLYFSELISIDINSENTEVITEMSSVNPLFIFIPLFYAPVMEELIFRKILIRELTLPLPMFLKVLISSFLFSIFHGEVSHLHVYMSIGLVLSFIYIKTNRLIIPILSHFSLNLTVFIIQFYFVT